jgi:sugar phosphate permease
LVNTPIWFVTRGETNPRDLWTAGVFFVCDWTILAIAGCRQFGPVVLVVALDWACAGKAVSATSGMVNVFGTVGREVYHGAVLNRRGR